MQNALVIALHDDRFVAEMHADPERTLAPLGLGEAERAQLLGVDRRAWRTDPLRRRRTLRILAEELKASTTLALAETRSLAFAEAFFSSTFFRTAIAERRSLAPAFGDYLADAAARGAIAAPHARDVIALETTTARARRARGAPQAAGVALAPGVAVGRFDGSTLDAVQAIERWLFEASLMPQAGLCDDAPRLPPLPPYGAGAPLYLLFTPSRAGVALTAIDEDLHGVLSSFERPRARGELAAALAPRGVSAAAARGLVDSLIQDGLLGEG
jgi:hypothetical protein